MGLNDGKGLGQVLFIGDRDVNDEATLSQVAGQAFLGNGLRRTRGIVQDLQGVQAHGRGQSAAQGFANRLFGREAFGQIRDCSGEPRLSSAKTGLKDLTLLLAQNPVDQPIAPAVVERPHTCNHHHIGSNADNHRQQASRISRFISRTASRMPTKTARETMA